MKIPPKTRRKAKAEGKPILWHDLCRLKMTRNMGGLVTWAMAGRCAPALQFLRVLAALSLTYPCALNSFAQGTPESTAKDKLNSLWERAGKAISAVPKRHGRIVMPGAKPQIVVSKGRLYFDGKELVFGGPIADWRSTIGKGDSCSARGETPGWCKWDKLGLEILGTIEKPQAVVEFTLYLIVSPGVVYEM